MSIYKVHIKTEGDKIGSVTTYTTNATTLVTVLRSAECGKYEITTLNNDLRLADTAEEADRMARESITVFMAKLGIVPNFIIE